MKEYNIAKILEDPELWAELNNVPFLEILDVEANNAFSRKTFDGYIASLLIYHQISEELLKSLIKISNLFISCLIFPGRYNPKNLNSLRYYGELIAEAKRITINEDEEKLIALCDEFNNLRKK